MKTLDELRELAEIALAYEDLIAIAAYATSPSTALQSAKRLGWDQDKSASCRYLAVIARDHGIDEFANLVESENPDAYENICLCDCHVGKITLDMFLEYNFGGEYYCNCCDGLEESCFHAAHFFEFGCPLANCPIEDDEDCPCHGCQYQEDICQENCEGCSYYDDNLACAECEESECSEDEEPEPESSIDPEEPIDRLERIKHRLEKVVGHSLDVKVYKGDAVNGCANGSEICVSSGAVEKLSESELAHIVSHELAHNLKRHPAINAERYKMMKEDPKNVFMQSKGLVSGIVKGVIACAIRQAEFCSVSQHNELEADRLGKELAEKAGYESDGSISMLEKVGSGRGGIFDTHPSRSDRIRNLKRK